MKQFLTAEKLQIVQINIDTDCTFDMQWKTELSSRFNSSYSYLIC
jgi:hypothetical protein